MTHCQQLLMIAADSYAASAGADSTFHDDIPVEPIAEAIRSCEVLVMPDRLQDTAHETHRQGYIAANEERELLEKLSRLSEQPVIITASQGG